MALLKANTGIGITNPSSALHVIGDGLFIGIVSATTFYGNLGGGVQGSVPYQSAVNTTTFLSPGTSGQVLVTAGSGQNPFWASASSLAGSFTGITIKDEGSIVGSAASISSLNFVGSNIVATTSGAGATITLSNDAQYLTGTAPGSVISQSNGFTVTGNVSISGNLSVGGTTAILNAESLQVKDKDIVLGITTNALNQDVSTDASANHGGIAIASTEGSPLIDINAGVGTDSIPITYKQIMWLKSGSWTGLGTDAWLFNYGVGIGSTQFPNGTRLAVGSVKFTENDLVSVRNINASGIITATQFVGSFSGNVTTATYADSAGIATYATNAGIATYATSSGIATYATTAGIATNVIGGIASVTSLSVSGISTLGTVRISSGIVTATSGVVTYYGDGSNLTNINIGSISGAIGGITIRDEGTTVGTASSITSINFVGGNVVATASGVGATITIADNLVGTALSISGISTFNNGPVFIGAATSTGTASQPLQVTGGAYVSGNLGIGATNPTSKLSVSGNSSLTGITTFYYDAYGFIEVNPTDGNGNTAVIRQGTNYPRNGGNLKIRVDASVQGGDFIVATGGDNERLRALNSGNIGIGTSNPTQTLHVQGNVRITGGLYDSNNNVGTAGSVLSSTGSGLSWIAAASGGISSVSISTNTTNQSQYLTYAIGTGNTTGLGVSLTGLVFNPSTGNLGIGTIAATSALTVRGDVLVSGVVTCTDINSTSDIKLKENISSIDNPLDKIIKLEGVNFQWKATGRKTIGVIAQEVEKMLPELISDGETKTVNYNGIIAVLIEAVKELSYKVEELNSQINK